MSQTVTLYASWFYYFFLFDQLIADKVKAAGCQHCGGKLHRANYPGHPRGLPDDPFLSALFSNRFSFCCSNRECRKRHTPASVRFLGQRVYTAAYILLLSIQLSVDQQVTDQDGKIAARKTFFLALRPVCTTMLMCPLQW